MSKYITKAIATSIIVIVITIAIIANYFIVKFRKEQENIKSVLETYTEITLQDRLNNEKAININDLMLKIDGKQILGVIKINKIGFEKLIYSEDKIDNEIIHCEYSPYLIGNVCLESSNYKKYWTKLYKLRSGDLIKYTSFLGQKIYKVNQVYQITETNYGLLRDTNDNILTIMICNKKTEKTLCIQAIEIH